MVAPEDEAAAILNHYFVQLARHCGPRWTERNALDIERASALLAQVEEESLGDEIPPYERPIVSDRLTQVFERNENGAIADPNFQKWRGQRALGDDDAAVQRMVRRG
jgi:hypothetical protein